LPPPRRAGILACWPPFQAAAASYVAASGEASVTMGRLLDKGAPGPLHLKRPDAAALLVAATAPFARTKVTIAWCEATTSFAS